MYEYYKPKQLQQVLTIKQKNTSATMTVIPNEKLPAVLVGEFGHVFAYSGNCVEEERGRRKTDRKMYYYLPAYVQWLQYVFSDVKNKPTNTSTNNYHLTSYISNLLVLVA